VFESGIRRLSPLSSQRLVTKPAQLTAELQVILISSVAGVQFSNCLIPRDPSELAAWLPASRHFALRQTDDRQFPSASKLTERLLTDTAS
jgi:hypothetical protein